MKNFRNYIIVFGLIFLGLLVAVWLYSFWGRTLVYKDPRFLDRGLGKISTQKPAYYELMNVQDQTDTFSVDPVDVEKYDVNQYNRTFVPEHVSVDFIIGYFRGWENVPGSNGIYLLLDEGAGVSKYRIFFENDIQTLANRTSFAVQTVGREKVIDGFMGSIFDPLPGNWTFERIKKAFRSGDIVVITPQYADNLILKVDNNGMLIANTVSLRRVFGLPEITIETLF